MMTTRDKLLQNAVNAILDGKPLAGIDARGFGAHADIYQAIQRASSVDLDTAKNTFLGFMTDDPTFAAIMNAKFVSRFNIDDCVHVAPKISWTVSELLSAEFPEPKWAVPELLPAGLVVLAGRPKLGKSWLSLQIAVAVGTGGVVLGRKVEPGRVLYLALEDNPRRLQNRLTKQRAGAGADIEFRFDWPAMIGRGGVNAGVDALQTAIDNGGYKLVIIDTISRALGHADQLDQADMNVAFGSLQRLAIEKDICLLLVDHHRKSAAGVGDVIDDVMGATSKVGVADAAVGIYRQRGKPEATLKVSGRDVDDHEIIITFDRELFCWQLVGNADDIKEDSAQSDILTAITELGGTATITRLAKWLGKQAPNVAREIGELVARGKLVKCAKQGKEVPYSLPQSIYSSDDNNDNNDNRDNRDNYDNYHWTDKQ